MRIHVFTLCTWLVTCNLSINCFCFCLGPNCCMRWQVLSCVCWFKPCIFYFSYFLRLLVLIICTTPWRREHVLTKIHHCTFRAWKLQSFWQNFLINSFTQKFSIELHTNAYFHHWADNHYCKNSLSSLHISFHHSIFCASMHVKTSLAWRDSIVTKWTAEETVVA